MGKRIFKFFAVLFVFGLVISQLLQGRTVEDCIQESKTAYDFVTKYKCMRIKSHNQKDSKLQFCVLNGILEVGENAVEKISSESYFKYIVDSCYK